MFDDSRAPTIPPDAYPHPDAEYDAIVATIAATERGRWFLEEHAHRHRGSDTERVLDAIERLERNLGSPAQIPRDRLRRDVAAMRTAIVQAHAEIREGGDGFVVLLELTEALEHRLREVAEQLGSLGETHAEEPPDLPRQESRPARTSGTNDPATWPMAALTEEPPGSDLATDAAPSSADSPPSDMEPGQGAPMLDATVTDWAYAPEEVVPAPRPAQSLRAMLPPIDLASRLGPDLHPRSPPPVAAAPSPDHRAAEATIPLSLEQIEAREYQRRQEEESETEVQFPEPARVATAGPMQGQSDLLVAEASFEPREPDASSLPADLLAPADPVPAADDPLFDTDLFETDQGPAGASGAAEFPPAPEPAAAHFPEERAGNVGMFEPAEFLAAPPDGDVHAGTFVDADGRHDAPEQAVDLPLPDAESPASGAGSEPPADAEAEGDNGSLIQRLEAMREAIASLLDEVADKSGRGREAAGRR
jgi:hypothetical protein